MQGILCALITDLHCVIHNTVRRPMTVGTDNHPLRNCFRNQPSSLLHEDVSVATGTRATVVPYISQVMLIRWQHWRQTRHGYCATHHWIHVIKIFSFSGVLSIVLSKAMCLTILNFKIIRLCKKSMSPGLACRFFSVKLRPSRNFY